MNERGADLVIKARRLSSGLVIVPCRVGPTYELQMLLNTGRPLSYLSVDSYEALRDRNLVDFIGSGVYRLRDFVIDENRVSDLYVRVSGAVGALGFEGMLGLHFLKQFRRVCFDNETDSLILTG